MLSVIVHRAIKGIINQTGEFVSFLLSVTVIVIVIVTSLNSFLELLNSTTHIICVKLFPPVEVSCVVPSKTLCRLVLVLVAGHNCLETLVMGFFMKKKTVVAPLTFV